MSSLQESFIVIFSICAQAAQKKAVQYSKVLRSPTHPIPDGHDKLSMSLFKLL